MKPHDINLAYLRRAGSFFWLSTAGFMLLIDLIATSISGNPLTVDLSMIFMVRWLIWIFFTPLVMRHAIKYPLFTTTEISNLRKHLSYATYIALLTALIETAVIAGTGYLIGKSEQVLMRLQTYLLFSIYLRFLIYFFIVAVATTFFYVRRAKNAEIRSTNLKAELAQAELKALKMQIQPHFLFNTHQALIGLMTKNRVDDAIKVVLNLSGLLRNTLEISEAEFIPITREIRMVEQYLTIQKFRFGDRLDITLDVSEDVLSARIPPLLLQPLVENAITHGVTHKNGVGVINVRVRNAGSHLRIEVRDNGGGIKPARQLAKNGMAIDNIVSRLEKSYASNFSFTLGNRQDSGAEAVVEIPFDTPGTREKRIASFPQL